MGGINTRIKTILKSANCIKQFYRLRNLIMYSINKNIPIKIIVICMTKVVPFLVPLFLLDPYYKSF